MRNVRNVTYDYVKWRQDHAQGYKPYYGLKREQERVIYHTLYLIKSFLHPMMTDIKRNLI